MECPNCITPEKCIGIHISSISDTVYRSEYGYFMFINDKRQWIFTPIEKDFDIDTLMDITDILRNLNENRK
jgi:hypothetical protein